MSAGEGDLFRVVYRSRIAPAVADVSGMLAAIVATSRRRNALSGVTGALMFTGSSFVQALEGPADAVEATFERIACDLRHVGLEVLECGPVLDVAFGRWSMSHLVPGADVADSLDRAADASEVSDAAANVLKLMVALIRAQMQDPIAGGTVVHPALPLAASSAD